ncbi:MAG: VTT domain-containing protein [Clostridia bacterium]
MKKNYKWLKIIILIIVILLTVIFTIKLLPFFKNLSTINGRIDFKNNIENLGGKGVVIIIGLILVQILLPFLPGEPIELLSGMCYGAFNGLLVVFLASFVSSLIIFVIVKKLGKKFVYDFIGESKVKKLENSKLFSNQQYLNLILFLVFFIPGTPKDLFVYIGALLPVNPVSFLLISTFARFPSIISSTLVGSNILDGNWISILVIYICSFIFSAISIAFMGYIKKRNLKKKATFKI